VRSLVVELILTAGSTSAAASLAVALIFGAADGSSFAGSLARYCLVAAVAVAAAALFARRRVTKPFGRLASSLEAVTEGDADLSADIATAARGEVGELSRRYGAFLARLNGIVSGLKTLVDASTEIGENVEAATMKAATLSREVGASIQKNKEMIASLDSEIDRSSEGVGGVKTRFGEVAGLLIEKQSSSVIQSTAAIEEMVASIANISSVAAAKKRQSDGLLGLVASSSSDMQKSLEAIREVVKSAEGLIDVVGLIRDVAERVDLLAMNAAIEAAHAAQAGRGFAVVADEIRKLAVTTDSQVKAISERLSQMIGQMHGAERATLKTDESMKLVMASIGDVADGMTEISGGVSEISVGSAEVLKSLQMLVEVTERVRSASNATNEDLAQVDGAIASIAALSEGSLRNAERMETLIGEIDGSFAELLKQGKINAEQIAGIDRSIAVFRTKRTGSSFIVGFNDVPPFSMEDGRRGAQGAANAFLSAVLAEMGVASVEFKHIQSLERIYELLDRGAIDAYTLATREYGPNPRLRYRVPAKPSISPAPGLLMAATARLDRVRSASDLSGLRIVTKNGMPLTKTMEAEGLELEHLGGVEPLVDGVRLVLKGKADAVYSMIAAELLFMAKGLGAQDRVKVVQLPDPRMEMFTAFSLPAADRHMAAFDAAQARVAARSPFTSFLEPFLGPGATV
jgi:methyl-accepting chemotaxis protein